MIIIQMADTKDLAIRPDCCFNMQKTKSRQDIFDEKMKTDKIFQEKYVTVYLTLYIPTIASETKTRINQLLQIYDDIDYLESKMPSLPIYPPLPAFFTYLYDRLEELLMTCKTNGLDLSKYATELPMSKSDIVNGYQLYNLKGDIRIFEIRFFLKLSQLLLGEDINITYEEFVKKLEDKCCTDWYKQDPHGEHYAGFRAYPEGTPERENAWDLTFESQCKGLWNLPYPKKLVLKMINQACCRRMDCVRGVNFLCEWLKRKHQMVVVDDCDYCDDL